MLIGHSLTKSDYYMSTCSTGSTSTTEGPGPRKLNMIFGVSFGFNVGHWSVRYSYPSNREKYTYRNNNIIVDPSVHAMASAPSRLSNEPFEGPWYFIVSNLDHSRTILIIDPW